MPRQDALSRYGRPNLRWDHNPAGQIATIHQPDESEGLPDAPWVGKPEGAVETSTSQQTVQSFDDGGGVDDLPDAPWDTVPPPKPTAPVPEPTGGSDLPDAPWASGAPTFAKTAGQAQGPGVAPENAPAPPVSVRKGGTDDPFYGPMPGPVDALYAGLKHGVSDVSQSVTAMSSNPDAVPANPGDQNPAAAPLEWRDAAEWLNRGIPKLAYRLGESAPSLAGGILGGGVGAGVGSLAGGPPGTAVGGLLGGAAGSAAGAAMQTLGPTFAQNLREDPSDPDGAWNKAVNQAMISGAFSGASWAAFPLKFFQGPVKNLAFQVFGVQPTIGTAQQVTQNVAAGKPYDENVGQNLAESMVGSVVPMLGHFALEKPTTSAAPDPNVTPRSKVGQAFVNNVMPEMKSERALQADPVAAKYKDATQQEKDALTAQTHKDQRAWDTVPQADQLAFIHAIETGQPVNPALQGQNPHLDMQGQANILRQRLENAYREEQQYGSPSAYVQDYLPHLWKQPDQAAQFGADWFQKTRTFPTLQDGLNAGMEPSTTNPVALVNHRLFAGIDMRQRVEFLQGLEQRGMAMQVDPHNPPPSDWTQVKAPNQEQWAMAPDAKPLWDRAVKDVSLWSRPDLAGDLFRGYSAVKNGFIAAKLGLSGFHILHVLHIQGNDALARGIDMAVGPGQQSLGERAMALPKALVQGTLDQLDALPIGTPHYGKEIRKAWQTMPQDQTPEQAQMVKTMTEGGFRPQMSEQLKLQTKTAFRDAIKQGQYLKAIPPALAAPFRALQIPIFEHWIPNLKAASYMNSAADLAARRPDIWADDIQRPVALRAIAKQVDNRFGEMNYDTLFWQRYMRDATVAMSTSAGWNLGYLREHVGALIDPITNRTMTQTPERQTMRAARNRGIYNATYMLSAMAINGLMTSYLSGQSPEGWDYVFPRIGGNNPDGSPRRVNNMFYTRELPMIVNHIQQSGLLGGLATTAMDKSALLGPAGHVISGQDYFGQRTVDENAPGWQQALQYGKAALNEVDPITFTSAQRALQLSGKPHELSDVIKGIAQGDPDVMRSLAGFSPSPVYANRTATENMISKLYGEDVAAKSKPYDAGQKQDRRAAIDAFLVARQTEDPEKIKEAAQNLQKFGVKPQSIAKMQPGTMLPYLFGTLPKEDQIAVLSQAPKDEFKKFYANPKLKPEVRRDPTVMDRWKHWYGAQ